MKPVRHSYRPLYITLITIIIAMLVTACDSSRKTYTIGIINLTPVLEGTAENFKKSMAELGYIEGENVTYLYEGATIDLHMLDSVAQDLVKSDVDLILSITTPATQAAQRATANIDIPVVFVPVTDPVGAGIVKSLRQPGRNVTGVTFGFQEGRRLEWLINIAPTIEEIYILYNPEDRSAVLALEMASATAAKLGVEIIPHQARTADEVMTAIEHIPEEADAVFILPDGLVASHLSALIEAANTRKLPTSGPSEPSIEQGALMVYGIWEEATAKQAARLADQILRGVKPSELPVEMAEFYLGINLQTAEVIDLDISEEILLQADIIIR